MTDCMSDGNEGSSGAPNQTTYYRASRLYCQIKPLDNNSLDQRALLQRLRTEVDKTIEAGGARIEGGSYDGPDSFDLQYVSGDRRGWVDVLVARGEPGYLSLVLVMREISA